MGEVNHYNIDCRLRISDMCAYFKSRFTTETQRAQRRISYDPIGPTPRRSGFGRAGGRRRLDHKEIPLSGLSGEKIVLDMNELMENN
jgi:hypothetical protein